MKSEVFRGMTPCWLENWSPTIQRSPLPRWMKLSKNDPPQRH